MSRPSLLLAIRKLLSLISNKEKWDLAKLMSFSLSASIFEIITATSIVILSQILNKPQLGQHYFEMIGFKEPLSANNIILLFALAVGLLYIMKNMLAACEIYYQHFAIQKMNYRFKKKLLARFTHIDYATYLTKNSAEGIALVSSDSELTFSNGMLSLTTIFSEMIVFFSLIGFITYLNPELALAIFVLGGILTFTLIKGSSTLFYRWGQRLQVMTILEHKNLLQFFHGFKEIVLLGKRESFVNAFHISSRERSKVQAIQNVTNVMPRILTELLFVGLFIICICYFCLTNHNNEEMIGILGGYLYIGFRLMPGFNRMVTQLNTFKSIIPSIEKIHHEFNLNLQKLPILDIPNLQFNHAICLKDIYYQYPNSTNVALQNINLEIKKGEWLGIIGETGSGKSTLSDLILGLLMPQRGQALIDNQFPLHSHQWHSLIGYVPQTVYLIDDSIGANIVFGDDLTQIDKNKLNKAVAGAQLHSFVASLAQGLDTPVGDRGIQLSGGERQRIAIARALYREPQVLIFDEATSALDNETEARLMSTIEAIHQNHTIIMIAHRLSTLKNCDRILLIKQGKIDQLIEANAIQEATNPT